MFLARKWPPLIRPVASALVCSWMLAGCAHDLARTSLDFTLPLTGNEVARSPPNPLRAAETRLVSSPGDQAASVPAAPAEILPPAAPEPAQGAEPSQGAAVPDSAGQLGARASQSLRPLPLEGAIQFALQNNPRLRAALAAIQRARGEQVVAFAPFLPQIDILNRYVATGKSTLPGAPGPTGVVNVTGIGPYSVWQSELQLQWMIHDFGRTEGRFGQASVREQIAELQAVRARETVAFDVATAYLQALEAAALRQIAEETIRRAQAVLNDAAARREGGVAVKDDVLRGEVQLSESREALVRATDDQITALAQLNNAMGREASWPVQPAGALQRGRFTASLAECLERAATQRPEVGVARDRVAVAQFGRLAAQGEFMPELKMLGSIGGIEGENVVGGLQEGIGINFNVPLYHGGAKRGNMAAAQADIREALADGQTVLNDISLEVTLAHRAVVSAQARALLAQPAVEQSAEALRIVRERYRGGTATPTDVIDAETTLTRAEQRYASARIEYLSALARLAYVMGEDAADLCLPLTAANDDGVTSTDPQVPAGVKDAELPPPGNKQ
jgi:outer membrane protein